MENSLISTRSTDLVTRFDHIVNPTLRKFAVEIGKESNNVGNALVRTAKILAKADAANCFDDDGFKGVGDFAEKLFGIKKSAASQLVTVANRFYNADSQPPFIAYWSPYTLYYLRDIKDDEIIAALGQGELSQDSTQKEVKEWAANHAKSDGDGDGDGGETAKIAKGLEVEVTLYKGKNPPTYNVYHNMPLVAFDSEISEFQEVAVGNPVKFNTGVDGMKGLFYYGQDGIIVIRYVPTPKEKKAPKTKATTQDAIKSYLQEMSVEERKEALRAMGIEI